MVNEKRADSFVAAAASQRIGPELLSGLALYIQSQTRREAMIDLMSLRVLSLAGVRRYYAPYATRKCYIRRCCYRFVRRK